MEHRTTISIPALSSLDLAFQSLPICRSRARFRAPLPRDLAPRDSGSRVPVEGWRFWWSEKRQWREKERERERERSLCSNSLAASLAVERERESIGRRGRREALQGRRRPRPHFSASLVFKLLFFAHSTHTAAPNHLQQQNSLSSSRPASPPSTAALPPRNPPLRARGAQEEPRAAAAAGLLPLRPSPEPAAASPTRTRRCTPSTTSTRSCSSERKGSRGHGRG